MTETNSNETIFRWIAEHAAISYVKSFLSKTEQDTWPHILQSAMMNGPISTAKKDNFSYAINLAQICACIQSVQDDINSGNLSSSDAPVWVFLNKVVLLLKVHPYSAQLSFIETELKAQAVLSTVWDARNQASLKVFLEQLDLHFNPENIKKMESEASMLGRRKRGYLQRVHQVLTHNKQSPQLSTFLDAHKWSEFHNDFSIVIQKILDTLEPSFLEKTLDSSGNINEEESVPSVAPSPTIPISQLKQVAASKFNLQFSQIKSPSPAKQSIKANNTPKRVRPEEESSTQNQQNIKKIGLAKKSAALKKTGVDPLLEITTGNMPRAERTPNSVEKSVRSVAQAVTPKRNVVVEEEFPESSDFDEEVPPKLPTPARKSVIESKPTPFGMASRRRWTVEETELLRSAVRKHGKQWSMICRDSEFNFQDRTQTNLKDKWRNLIKYGHDDQ